MAKSSQPQPFSIAPRDFPDRAFQTVLKNPENLQELVQVAAPEQAPFLDCLRAEFRDPRFYLDDWRRLAADLLFNVPIVGVPDQQVQLAIVLIEQQTAAKDDAVFRTSLHHHMAWAEDWKKWEEKHKYGQPLRLAPPIPIILHTNATTSWNAAREFRDLFEGPDELLRHVQGWKPLIWEVAKHSPEELLEMAGPWLNTLAVVRTEKEPFPRFAETVRETFERLSPLAQSSHVRWADLVKFVVSWTMNRRVQEEREPLAELAVKSQRNAEERNEVQAMSQTIAEWFIKEGEIKGQIKGKLEGKLETQRANLERLIKRKFPHKFDESAAARIQAAENAATLADWIDALVDADSWKDFKKLAGWPKSNGDAEHGG